MNALDLLFSQKQKDLFTVYFTVGFPYLESMPKIISSLEKSNVDIIEIGIPFSDPLADGKVIQSSSEIALQNGMNIQIMFDQLSKIKTDVPLIIMTYFNPIYKFGFEKFCKLCQQHSISGLIIPDLPLVEYQSKYKIFYQKYNLHFIPLVSPRTRKDRLKELCDEATGFIYAVSGDQTTGISENKKYFDLDNYCKTIRTFSNEKPILLGFGIDNSNKYKEACSYFDGGIIGSSFINYLINYPDELENNIMQFCQTIKPISYDHSIN